MSQQNKTFGETLAAQRRRTPTPTIRGNLPHHRSEDWDETEGRELPRRPMEWYERGQTTPQGTTTYRHSDFGPYPPSSGRGLTEADIEQLRREEPTARYNKGGAVKHGSPTHVTCKTKDQ